MSFHADDLDALFPKLNEHQMDALGYLLGEAEPGALSISARRFGKSSMSLAETFRSIEEGRVVPDQVLVRRSGSPGLSITLDEFAASTRDALTRRLAQKMVTETITTWLESDTTLRRCQGCKFFRTKPGSSMDGKCGNLEGMRSGQPVKRTEGCGRNLTEEERREKATAVERQAFRNGTQKDGW